MVQKEQITAKAQEDHVKKRREAKQNRSLFHDTRHLSARSVKLWQNARKAIFCYFKSYHIEDKIQIFFAYKQISQNQNQ
ncbi:MAG: hypothetical protein K2P33_03725, partial [Acutalibacter sp.]|nr:hypothetical protein [Acutalibacter sp.]